MLREAIILHFCSLISLLDLLVPCAGAGGRRGEGGARQPARSGKLPITLAVNFSIFLLLSVNIDL